jgi:hypothetical protein
MAMYGLSCTVADTAWAAQWFLGGLSASYYRISYLDKI